MVTGLANSRIVALCAAALMCLPGLCLSQGLNGQSLQLSAPGTSVFGSHEATSLGKWKYSIGLSSQYMRDSLLVVKDGETLREVSKNRVDAGFHSALGILPWLDVGLDVPFVAYHDGEGLGADGLSGNKLGDIRSWVKAIGLKQEKHFLNLAGLLTIGVPTGEPGAFSGAGGFSADGVLVLSRKFGALLANIDVGYRYRPKQAVMNFVDGDRLLLSTAVTYHHEKQRLKSILRVFGSSPISSMFKSSQETNLELLGGVEWRPWRGLVFLAGVGAGVLSGARTPAYRALATAGWHVGKDAVHYAPLPELPMDTDLDQIPDKSDKCPTAPEDFDGFEDGDGCPDLDNDQDGIADSIDKCPNEPESKNGEKDDDGCPEEQLVTLDIAGGQIHVLVESVVLFDFARTNFGERAQAVLKQIAYVMKRNPEIDTLRIDGHSSWTGKPKFNKYLSLKRARTVMAALIELGVSPRRLKAKGWGYSRLKVKRRGPKYNKVNRRVEFVIVGKVPSRDSGVDEFEPEEGDSTLIQEKKTTPKKERSGENEATKSPGKKVKAPKAIVPAAETVEKTETPSKEKAQEATVPTDAVKTAPKTIDDESHDDAEIPAPITPDETNGDSSKEPAAPEGGASVKDDESQGQ